MVPEHGCAGSRGELQEENTVSVAAGRHDAQLAGCAAWSGRLSADTQRRGSTNFCRIEQELRKFVMMQSREKRTLYEVRMKDSLKFG